MKLVPASLDELEASASATTGRAAELDGSSPEAAVSSASVETSVAASGSGKLVGSAEDPVASDEGIGGSAGLGVGGVAV